MKDNAKIEKGINKFCKIGKLNVAKTLIVKMRLVYNYKVQWTY